ncbi:hypothetical protein D3C86_1558170 [compost metagenome]
MPPEGNVLLKNFRVILFIISRNAVALFALLSVLAMSSFIVPISSFNTPCRLSNLLWELSPGNLIPVNIVPSLTDQAIIMLDLKPALPASAPGVPRFKSYISPYHLPEGMPDEDTSGVDIGIKSSLAGRLSASPLTIPVSFIGK